jgi:hypothetical protein
MLLRPFVFCALALVLLAGMQVVYADHVPQLDGQLTDLTGEVDRSEAEGALTELLDEANIQLWVLFVESTYGAPIPTYTDDVVFENNLGGRDVLLVVALSDRTYQLWIGPLLTESISESEEDRILAERLEPQLVDGDFAAGIRETAEGVREAAGGSLGGSGGLDLGFLMPILIILAVVGVVIIIAYVLMAGTSGGKTQPDRVQTAGQDAASSDPRKRASALLIQTDEAIRDARQELAFAEAEFTPAEVQSFRDAIERAAAELTEAFRQSQALSDSTPDDPIAAKTMAETIVTKCDSAKRLLDEQLERIDALRDLETRAPEVLRSLEAGLPAISDRLPKARESLAALQGLAENSWLSVQGNIVEAEKRIADATAQIKSGLDAAARGDNKAASGHARYAQDASAQADALLDAVEGLAENLSRARQSLQKELASAEANISAAAAALASESNPTFDARLARARSSLEQARKEAEDAKPDYLLAYELATSADVEANDILSDVSEAGEKRGALDSSIDRAETLYRRADDFIRSRRSWVGAEARTRLAEANRHLQRARAESGRDVTAALEDATTAARLAESAYEAARGDVDEYDQPYSYRRRRGGMSPFDILLGGGGIGWNGTHWGQSGGSRSRGGFGRSSGGSWGGGGRSSGGGFGGGGGRSSGGRW